jgi:two-component system, chemotaxis family, protein-glutamate methylesterase/glutaminase
MTPRCASHLVAVAFSAGGLQPLIHLLHALPADFASAIAVVHHAGSVSCLPDLLSNQTALTVKFAECGETLLDGTVYVCPPLHHLLVNPDATVGLSSNARLSYVRPSADWFFRTVAGSFDARAAAVVLSGASNDGAKGISKVFEAGGQIFVQDPQTCMFPTMPQAALDAARSCGVHAPDELGPALIAASQQRDLTTAQAEWDHPFGPIAA